MARKKNRKKRKPTSKKQRERSATEAPDREAAATQEPSHGAAPVADLDAEEPSVTDMGAHDAPVVDLDTDDTPIVDLDADEEPTDAVEWLIAETLASAEEDVPAEPVEPVIDLDAGLDAEPDDTTDVAASDAGDAPGVPLASPASPTAEGGLDRPATVAGLSSVDEDEAGAEAAIRALIDFGPVSSPEVRDRLLAEALAHAEHKDARYRVPFAEAPAAARWKAILAFLIVLVAGSIAAVPPGWARPEPPAQLEPAERARNLRIALLLQAQQVEGFRVRAQRLPNSLDELPRTLPGVRYVRSGSRAYQLIAYEADGNAIVYDSANPTPPFSALATVWASAR